MLRSGQLAAELRRLGFEDHRDTAEIDRQARAAMHEFGLGRGFIEYDMDRQLDRGPERFEGDLRRPGL